MSKPRLKSVKKVYLTNEELEILYKYGLNILYKKHYSRKEKSSIYYTQNDKIPTDKYLFKSYLFNLFLEAKMKQELEYKFNIILKSFKNVKIKWYIIIMEELYKNSKNYEIDDIDFYVKEWYKNKEYLKYNDIKFEGGEIKKYSVSEFLEQIKNN